MKGQQCCITRLEHSAVRHGYLPVTLSQDMVSCWIIWIMLDCTPGNADGIMWPRHGQPELGKSQQGLFMDRAYSEHLHQQVCAGT